MTRAQTHKLLGRVIKSHSDELVYTVTSAGTDDRVVIYDPRKNEYVIFDSLETFSNWAYGTPIPTGF